MRGELGGKLRGLLGVLVSKKALNVVLAAALVMNGPFGLLATAQAQVVSDPRAPIQFQPRVGVAPNGTPVIDVTKPSFGGLSHNKYERYNVDTKGVILNNSGLGGTSILGGQIWANPNLVGSRPASVILNEVTGSTASLINGPTEVFGSKADVIVANPNGVTCRSCAFINTGRVTLSTGVPIPDYQTGNVAFEVKRGSVIIEGTGVASWDDGSGGKIGDLDLVGRQIGIAAPINSSGHVRLRAGAINWDQSRDTATRLTGADIPVVTGPAIHSTVASTIQAGTISVLSHDVDLGVHFEGDLVALGIEQQVLDGTRDKDGHPNWKTVKTAGFVTVSSMGDATLAGTGSNGDIVLNARNALTLIGSQQAMGRITASANDIVVGADASLLANDAIVFEAMRNMVFSSYNQIGIDENGQSRDILHAPVVQSGRAISLVAGDTLTASGSFSTVGRIDLEARTLAAERLGVSANAISVAALSDLSLERTALVSGTDVAVLGENVRLGAGTGFQAEGRIYVDARGILTNATILNYDNLSLNLGRSFVNEATGQFVADDMRLVLTDSISNAGLIYGRFSTFLSAQNLTNTATGTVYGPEVEISVAQNLINAGKILSEGRLSVTALGAMVNDGAMQANGAVTLRAASYTANSADAILAGASADLIIAGAFDNLGRVLGNQGHVDLSAETVINRASGIVYGDGVTIRNTQSVNNIGQILSESGLTLSASGGVVNAGAIRANGAISLDVDTYTGTGTASVAATSVAIMASGVIDNAGEILGDEYVKLSAGSLNNNAGGRVAGYDVLLIGALDSNGNPTRMSGAVNAGSIEALNLFNLSAVNLFNSGRISAYEISKADPGDAFNLLAGLDLTGSFNNTGQIQAENNLLLKALTLSNGAGATLQGRAVSALVAGDFNNSGAVISDAQLIITAANLYNSGTAANNAIISARYLQAAVTGHIGNGANSLIQGADSVTLSADTAALDLFHANGLAEGQFNYGKDFALTLRNQGLDIADGQSLIADGSLYLSLSGDINIQGILASRSDLSLHSGGTITLGRNDPNNPGGGEIFTRGNGEIIAAGDLRNYASVIQSLGSLYIEVVGTLLNTRTDQRSYLSGAYHPSIYAMLYGWNNPDKYTEYQTTTEETSQAAQIWADGNLVIKAGTVDNIASTMVAGNIFRITASSVNNASREVGTRYVVIKTGGDTNVGTVQASGYVEGLTYSQSPIQETTAALTGGAGFDASGIGTFNNTGLIQAAVIRIDANTLINGITDPNHPTAAPRLPDAVIDLTHYFTGAGSGSILGPALGNKVVINGVTYLNASPVPGDASERGPSWILEQVGDGREGLAFFADPTVERRMIQQALIEQTGRATLDPSYRNPAEQQEALWQATVDFLKANPDIKLGDTLTSQQRAALTQPVLWYETRIIDGQQVLVPQLILPEGRLNEWLKSNGGVMAADDIFLSGDSIHNTGAMLATNTLSIEAGTFTNERRVATGGTLSGFDVHSIQSGGLLAGDIVQVRTTGDLINIGGTIIADSGLNLVAGGNLILTASVVENEMHDGSKSHKVDAYSRTNYGGTVYSGGDATLYAGNDMRIEGSNVIALGNASLMAGGSITISSVLDETSLDQSGKKSGLLSQSSWSSSDHSQTNVSSTIFAGGNLTVAAAGDVNVHASHLVAGEDMLLAAGAGANGRADASVNITAGQDSTSHSDSKSKSGLFGGGGGWADIWHKKSIETSTDIVTNAGSSLSAGGDVTITAKNDINLQGSSVSAGGMAALDAGNNINITPGYNSYGSSYKREEKGIGIGYSAHDGTFKQQAGYHSDKIELGLETSTVVSSVIQGGAGVSLNAGNDINLQAATLVSPGNITLSAGHDINAGVAYDTTSMIAKHDEKFFGVTAQVSQNVTGAISQLKQSADTFRSGHGNAAYKAIGMASGIMQATDALMAATNPTVSVSVTVGGSGKSSSMYETSAQAVGTQIVAGGTVILDAGNNIHLQGAQVYAGSDLAIAAGNDIIIESAQSYASAGSKESSWNAGIGLGGSIGVNSGSAGIRVEGGYSHSDNESWSITQLNSQVKAGGDIFISSGKDTTVAGAVIHGSDVIIDVGGDLTVQSRQDTAHSEGSSLSLGGSLTVGAGASGSLNVGIGDSSSDTAWVREQTGIYSDGKMDIYVDNHTQIDGAVIASGSGDLTLDTGTLGFSDIQDHDKGSSLNVNVGISNDPATGKPSGGSLSGSVSDYDREQVDRATVGDGEIIVRNTEEQTQDVAALNRDIEKAQEIIKDESSGVDFYASTTAIEELSSGFETTRKNLENLANAGTLIPQNLQKAKQELNNIVLDSLGLIIPEGKFSATQKQQIANVALGYAMGDLTEEMIKNAGCSSRSGGIGRKIIDLIITPAYAQASGTCEIQGKSGNYYTIPHDSQDICIQSGSNLISNPSTFAALSNYIETSLSALGKAPEDIAQVLRDLRDEPLVTLQRLGPTLIGFFPPSMPIRIGVAPTGNVVARYGPMAEGPLPGNIANTFRSGSYSQVITQETTTLYRVYGGTAGETGSFWTTVKPSGPMQSQLDLALNPSWGNTAANVATIRVPPGVTYYGGYASAQGYLPGGGYQVFISNVNPSWIVR